MSRVEWSGPQKAHPTNIISLMHWEWRVSIFMDSGLSPVTSNRFTKVSSPIVQKTLLEGWQAIALIYQEWAKNSAISSPSNVANHKRPFANAAIRILTPQIKQLRDVTGTSVPVSGLKVAIAVKVYLSSIEKNIK